MAPNRWSAPLAVALWARLSWGQRFEYRDYDNISATLQQLAARAPHLVEIYTAQDRYGVASYGTCGSTEEPCSQHIVTITNQNTLPDAARPEVFFSGAVHGDERVGPTATVEFAVLLIDNYLSGQNEWLRRLVDSRIIHIMPCANAWGYAHNVRTEGSVDPNRDFPFGNGPHECMVTTAARAINEMYRDHLFQMALTFHSGMRAIAYEWGSPNHQQGADGSPDDGGFGAVGRVLHKYASETYYPQAGRMNTIVYPVTGGMEDWAYAASWDTYAGSYAPICNPSSFGGYPAFKTQYTTNMLRAFNILIETSDIKAPPESSLGSRNQVLLGHGSQYDGHVARNLRICLAMTDLAQPYLVWLDAAGSAVSPLAAAHIQTAIAGEAIQFAWDIGGATNVERTGIVLIPWGGSVCPDARQSQSMVQSLLLPLATGSNATIHPYSDAESLPGTIWGPDAMYEPLPGFPDPMDATWAPFKARYSATHTFPVSAAGSLWLVAAYAEVDAEWADTAGQGRPSGMPPQAHVVRARTQAGYHAENAGHQVHGYSKWFSAPMCYDVQGASSTERVSVTSSSVVSCPEGCQRRSDGVCYTGRGMRYDARATSTVVPQQSGVPHTTQASGGARTHDVSKSGSAGSTAHKSIGVGVIVALTSVLIVAVIVLLVVLHRRQQRLAFWGVTNSTTAVLNSTWEDFDLETDDEVDSETETSSDIDGRINRDKRVRFAAAIAGDDSVDMTCESYTAATVDSPGENLA